MRINFFLPTATTTPTPEPKEMAKIQNSILKKQMDEESMTSSEYEDSTAGEDSCFDEADYLSDEQMSQLELEEQLPEMDERQANKLKRLLLSPLEPDSDF